MNRRTLIGNLLVFAAAVLIIGVSAWAYTQPSDSTCAGVAAAYNRCD